MKYPDSVSVTERLLEILTPEEVEYLASHVDIESEFTEVMETSSRFNVLNLTNPLLLNFVNTKRINDIRFLNKFFTAVNSVLQEEGLFIGCAETKNLRKERLLNKYPKAISYPYYALDFFVKRVLPKWNSTRKLYFFLTRGQNRVFSLPEILGRLIFCGFEIVDYRKMNNQLFFVARKIGEPIQNVHKAYGILIRLRRVGKDGKIINVLKLRTMHPFSEYLQAYIFEQNNLQDGGKIKNDFRITTWGRVLRKMWLDELPMIWNLIKGDLKIVGVRPISTHYFELYRPELQKKRIRYKPGLIPPFYADLPKTLEEIMDSEERYLDAYEKDPILTDIKYFFKAFNNIVFKRARSN